MARRLTTILPTILVAYIISFSIIVFCFYELEKETTTTKGLVRVETKKKTTNRNADHHLDDLMRAEPTTTTTTTPPEEFTAACLCVNDDNHYLIEWLAYHYFVAGLRRLIIAPDPFSVTSIQPIVERWKDRMNITVWSNVSQYDYEGPVAHHEQNFYRRQEHFNWYCLKTLKQQQNVGWTFVIDVDEFMLVNPMLADENSNVYKEDWTYYNISEPSSVLRTLQQLILPDEQYNFLQPCMIMTRKQFSPRPTNHTLKQIIPAGFQQSQFQTLQWDRYGETDWPTQKCDQFGYRPIPGKSITDLQRIREIDLDHDEIMGGPHNPINTLCPDIFQPLTQSLLIVHHYVPDPQTWEYRVDPRGLGMRRVKYKFFQDFYGYEQSTDVFGWLEGFVKMVGTKEAKRLLANVGVLEPREKGPAAPPIENKSKQEEKYAPGDLVQVNHALEGVKWCEAEIIHAIPEYDIYNVLFSDDCFPGMMMPATRIRRNGTDNVDCS